MKSYVNLPEIKHIEVNNFNLYKNGNFEWDFSEKFSLFLGINGLGKTTTLTLIAYALVGLIEEDEKDNNNKNISKEEIKEFTEIREYGVNEKSYFKRYDNQKDSNVYLEFKLGENTIKVKRNILNHNIIGLMINNDEIIDDLDENYKYYFHKYSGMTIQSFIRILYTLLIRFEEAPSLLFRPRTQHTALRTLIFDSSFHGDFLQAERMYRSSESKYRGEKYKLVKIKKKLIKLEKEYNEIEVKLQKLNKNSNNENEYINEIEKNIKETEQQIFIIEQQIDNINEDFNNFKEQKRKLIPKKSKIEFEIEEIQNKILGLQEKFYTNIYSDNEIYNLAINSINMRKICIFCDSIVDDEKINILKESINQSKCPFCESKVNNVEKEEMDVNELNKLEALKNELIIKKKTINDEIVKINKLINSFTNEMKDLSDNRKQLIFKYSEEVDKLKKLKFNSSEDLDSDSILLQKQLQELYAQIKLLKEDFEEKCIKVFGMIIDYKIVNNKYTNNGKSGLEKEYYDAEKKYEELKMKSKETIKLLEKKIIQKFNKYNILTDQFNLIQKETKKIEQNINVKYSIFVPVNIEKGSNDVRDIKDKMSKSEQILLDYAFRLALIELYSEISNNKKVFIAFESSEGVFDLGNVEKFSNMLKKYAIENTLLLISNLNNIKYLQTIVSDNFISSSKSVLNFISISGKDNIDEKYYDDVWNEVFGKEKI